MRAGWAAGVLDDVCIVEYGTRVVRKKDGGKVYPVYGGGGETFRMDTFNRENRVVVSRFGVSDQCVRYVADKFFLNDSGLTVATRDDKKLLQRFLDYQLFSLNDKIYRLCRGTAQKNLDVDSFRQINIAIPKSTAEQQRIVTILDEAFVGLATATANADKNLKNAHELFDSYLNSVFEDKNEGWYTRPLAELCENDRVITYGVIKLGKEIPNGVPCLRTSNVRWLRIDTDGIKRISPALSNEFRRTILRSGEVLVNVRGTLGGVAIAARDMKGWNVSREVAVVPVDASRIEPAYLAYFIATRRSQGWLTDVQKGLAYVGINIADLRTLPISFPGKEVQIQLIEQFQKLSSESRRLEAVYADKLSQIDELKQAILQAAFSGELTFPPSQAIKEAAE